MAMAAGVMSSLECSDRQYIFLKFYQIFSPHQENINTLAMVIQKRINR